MGCGQVWSPPCSCSRGTLFTTWISRVTAVVCGGFSFDGSLLTNGFHPLWEYMLAALSRAGTVDFSHRAAALLPVYYLDVLLLALGAAFFAVFATRALRRPLLALLVFAPGLVWVCTGVLAQGYLSTWSYVNGMESA